MIANPVFGKVTVLTAVILARRVIQESTVIDHQVCLLALILNLDLVWYWLLQHGTVLTTSEARIPLQGFY